MPEPSQGSGSMAGRLGTLWCNLIHDAPMWPIHDSYRCRMCGRSYPVPWAGKETPGIPRAIYRRHESVVGSGV